MKITVINGTEVKGCTYGIKEAFLAPLRGAHEITEFYLPKDLPRFCTGCKACFFHAAEKCPHAALVTPIWDAIARADLLVFAAPVYALGIPAGLKALLDRFAVRWMVHRPDPRMFSKRAVVMTNCIGMPLMARSAQRDAVNALSWMGVTKIRRLGVGLLEGVIWDELSPGRRAKIEKTARRLGEKCGASSPARRGLKVRVKFFFCKILHQAIRKKEESPSVDTLYWLEQGWIQ
jgi:NAD(P)H-dependent FMN reductase